MKKEHNIKVRCGSRVLPNGVEVPENVQIRKGALGREFYVSSISGDVALIRYIDGKAEFKQVTLKQLNA